MPITRLYGWDCGDRMLNVQGVDWWPNCDPSTTQKKTGAYSLQLNVTGWCIFEIDTSPANPSVSFWTYMDSAFNTNADQQAEFLLDSGKYITLRWNSTSKTWDAYVDGALVASGTVPVSSGSVWFHTQFYVVIAAAGSIGVKIDGRQSINYSGDTQPGAEAGATRFRWIKTINANTTYMDDLAIGYGGYLGDIRCIDIRPSADTAQDDWTPSAGDNYSTIDEVVPVDTDYNEVNTDAQADELALGDFDGVTYNPVAVTAWVRAQMLAATGDSIKVGVDSGGTDDVTESPLSTTWAYYFHTADQNPADAAEWEDADIDALLLRYESVIA